MAFSLVAAEAARWLQFLQFRKGVDWMALSSHAPMLGDLILSDNNAVEPAPISIDGNQHVIVAIIHSASSLDQLNLDTGVEQRKRLPGHYLDLLALAFCVLALYFVGYLLHVPTPVIRCKLQPMG